MEKRYCYKIQAFCKTPCFGAVESEPVVINKLLLENIIDIAKEKAPLVGDMIFCVRASNFI